MCRVCVEYVWSILMESRAWITFTYLTQILNNMGKQKGAEQKIGTMGGLTYYRTAENGYLVRKKSSLDKKRVSKDPAFEKSRNAGLDFGKASAGCHLMRNT